MANTLDRRRGERLALAPAFILPAAQVIGFMRESDPVTGSTVRA